MPTPGPHVFQRSHHHACRIAIENRAKLGADMAGHDQHETDPVLDVGHRVEPALHPYPVFLGGLRPELEDQQADPARIGLHNACGCMGLLMPSAALAVDQPAATTTVPTPDDFCAAGDFTLAGASALRHATLGQQLAPA